MTPYIVAAGAGMSLGNSLFNDEDYSSDFDEAEKKYEEEMAKAEEALKAHEASGQKSLKRGLFGSELFGVPYRKSGRSALETYMGALGLGGDAARQSALQAFQTSPGYQFALSQGLEGVSRGMSSSGLRGSGAEEKALTEYATGLANQEYSSWENQLAGLAGMGQKSSEAAAQRMYGTGSQLADLSHAYGEDYAKMYGTIAQSMAETQLAKTQYQAQQAAQQGSMIGGALSSLGL
jgi:hypothetical protein